jgi:hypothetical protein
MARRTRHHVAHLFFSLKALGAARQLTALRAREQSTGAQALKDDNNGHRFVALERALRRAHGNVGEHSLVRVALATIDDVDARPAAGEIGITLVPTAVEQRGRRDY